MPFPCGACIIEERDRKCTVNTADEKLMSAVEKDRVSRERGEGCGCGGEVRVGIIKHI